MNEHYMEKLNAGYIQTANRPAIVAAIAAKVAGIPVAVTPLGDIAYHAHGNTSWTPEVRYLQEEQGYVEHLSAVWAEIASAPNAAEEFARYAAGYRERKVAQLNAASRCLSWAITGPAKFPTRRAARAIDSERKRSEELQEWVERAQKAMKRNLGLIPGKYDGTTIYSDDENAAEKLEARIAALEHEQERMKAANAIIRKRGMTDAAKIEELQTKVGLSDRAAHELLQPDFMGRVGFPGWALQNNNANIHRLRGRLEQVRRTQELVESRKVERESGEADDGIVFNGGRIIDNVEANRVQILFDAKPSAEIRSALKHAGFRWAPSNAAWQAFRNPRSIDQAKRILL